MKESFLYEKLEKNGVRCDVCLVRCFIRDGARGFCRTRANRGGTLYTLIYGKTSGVCVDPIEKKPLYHFHPGTQILSMGTRGCNFKCPGCQNWEISHDSPDEMGENLEEISPEQSVRLIDRTHCQGICWTYNDPSIWIEQTYETSVLARQHGFYTAYITNGYATPEQIDMIGPYLDAYRLDVKAFSRETYKKIAGFGVKLQEVLDGCLRARRKWGMHVECVTNVTPTINDGEDELRGMARWIKTELGEMTPWHVTRFYPYLDLSHIPPTPIPKLERAREIGLEEGLKFVYLGNVPGHPGDDTYCPKCEKLLIRRRGFALTGAWMTDGKCDGCGLALPGRWPHKIPITSGVRIPIPVA